MGLKIDKGDLVKCVNNFDYSHKLTIGAIYKVVSTEGIYVNVTYRGKHLGGYKAERFVKVPRKKTVWD